MRLTWLTIAAGIVCLAGVASASVITGQAPFICCCCDLRTKIVSCTPFIAKKDCNCTAAVCPLGAAMVWVKDNHTSTAPHHSQTKRLPVAVEDMGGVSSVLPVDEPVREEATKVLAVKEATGQRLYPIPTLNPRTKVKEARSLRLYPIPTLNPRTKVKEARGQRFYPMPTLDPPSMHLNQVKGAEQNSEAAVPTPGPASCCCCDIAIDKIVCQARDIDDCICAMVMCPENAETIYVTASPTTVP